MLIGLSTVTVSIVFFIGVILNNHVPSTKSVSNAANPYVRELKNNAIRQTMISKSESLESFNPQPNTIPMGVAVISGDEKWDQTLLDALNKMTVLKEKPKSSPNYDFLISLRNNDTLKFKVWIEDKTAIYKDIEHNTYYKTDTPLTNQFGYILNEMTSH
jgi:hypothetical protein